MVVQSVFPISVGNFYPLSGARAAKGPQSFNSDQQNSGDEVSDSSDISEQKPVSSDDYKSTMNSAKHLHPGRGSVMNFTGASAGEQNSDVPVDSLITDEETGAQVESDGHPIHYVADPDTSSVITTPAAEKRRLVDEASGKNLTLAQQEVATIGAIETMNQAPQQVDPSFSPIA
ncbi:MAG: hypothetical protein SFU25_12230 [Candidatus Caenarcaniphilales bacterium]|nr:hypothetical protein [Candidatus Caenarcaniphilales bacterium]